jgi:hypothetical protein
MMKPMSATGRGAERQPNDFYVTPAWAVHAIQPHLPAHRHAFDPCAGDGSLLIEMINEKHVTWVSGFEIDPTRAKVAQELLGGWGTIRCADALGPEPWSTYMVVMNPPYKLALDFFERAITEVGPRGTVAALLRLGWLAGKKRQQWHAKHPTDVYVLAKRPSFQANGETDATEYAWFVHGAGRGGRYFIL